MSAPLLPAELRRLLKRARTRRLTRWHWLIGLILAAGYVNGAMALVELIH
jgi:hypothetical protein